MRSVSLRLPGEAIAVLFRAFHRVCLWRSKIAVGSKRVVGGETEFGAPVPGAAGKQYGGYASEEAGVSATPGRRFCGGSGRCSGRASGNGVRS